ncbi:MAG: cation:proton antiporter [Pseudolabrys sp.]|nr:cation:proton antiporter [Pseudolabrys sp.]
MNFFESLLLLLAIAIALLRISRPLAIPYPTMLAAAGVLLGLLPGAPAIGLDPQIALALFIAPALVDAAYDFPLNDIKRFWRPLFALAVIAVLLTAAAVAWLGVAMAGLPIYAAVALGAIVAPPDAAAATAVLRNVSMPRRSVVVLKGESLLNDASALILFGAALSFHTRDATTAEVTLRVLSAAPLGVLLGVALAFAVRRVMPYFTGTLGGNLLEFVTTFGIWIIAERLHISPVLCLVAFAMTLARTANLTTPPRMRIHSFAVWSAAVFLLNVLAFLLMGFQARTILGGMTPDRLREAAWFAGAVVLCVVVVRMVWAVAYSWLSGRWRWLRGGSPRVPVPQSILVGWAGMRGLVTLATAFALPATFPERDMIVLAAFAVVLATLVVQGLTLGPLVRLLGLDGEDGLQAEIDRARAAMASQALQRFDGQSGVIADQWRYSLTARIRAIETGDEGELTEKRRLGLDAIRHQRHVLEEMRRTGHVGADAFLILQEELDFTEVTLSSEAERQIEES